MGEVGSRGRSVAVEVKESSFDQFFSAATGVERKPYDYQRRLAGGDDGTPCVSQLIDIPTGLGKTAARWRIQLWSSESILETSPLKNIRAVVLGAFCTARGPFLENCTSN